MTGLVSRGSWAIILAGQDDLPQMLGPSSWLTHESVQNEDWVKILPRQYEKTHDPTPPHPTPQQIKKPIFVTCLGGLGVWEVRGKIVRVDLPEF